MLNSDRFLKLHRPNFKMMTIISQYSYCSKLKVIYGSRHVLDSIWKVLIACLFDPFEGDLLLNYLARFGLRGCPWKRDSQCSWSSYLGSRLISDLSYPWKALLRTWKWDYSFQMQGTCPTRSSIDQILSGPNSFY